MFFQVGVFEEKPSKIGQIMRSWMQDGMKELKPMAKQAKALAKPDALFDIVRDLSGLVSVPLANA